MLKEHRSEEVGGAVVILTVDGPGESLPAEIASIARAALGYPRGEEELRWNFERPEAYLYRRGETQPCVCLRSSRRAGPIAAIGTL